MKFKTFSEYWQRHTGYFSCIAESRVKDLYLQCQETFKNIFLELRRGNKIQEN